MTPPPDSLNLADVRAQWAESAQMLEAARGRLTQLAETQEAMRATRVSLDDAAGAVRGLADQASSSLAAVANAHDVAARTLESIATIAAAGDFATLMRTVEHLVDASARVSEHLEVLSGATSQNSASLAKLADGVRTLVDRVERDLAAAVAERDASRARLENVLAALPGRVRRRVEPAG